MSGKQEVKRASQAVDVGPTVDRAAFDKLLRCQKVRRCQRSLFYEGRRNHVVEHLCQSEVEDLDDITTGHQQIGGLDVAVDDSATVCISQTVCRLANVVGRLERRHWPHVSHPIVKAVTIDELHHEQMDFGLSVERLIDVVGSDDIRVLESSYDPSFAVESSQIDRVAQVRFRQHFDRTAAPHQRVFGKIDRARSAARQDRQQTILPQNEAAVFSSQQLFGLPLSQRSVAHERSSDRLRLTDVNSLLAQLDKKRCDAILADECAALQTAEKGVGCQLE